MKVDEEDDKDNYNDTYISVDCVGRECTINDLGKYYNDLYEKFPECLKNFMKKQKNNKYFRLATEKEIFGVNYHSSIIEPDYIKQWKPMMDRRNRVAFSSIGDSTWWWLDNKVDYSLDDDGRSTVFPDGACYFNDVNSLGGVRPVFQIDKDLF